MAIFINGDEMKSKVEDTVEARIAANDAKVGITPAQAGEITANTAKVGITTTQAGEITANTAKVGVTSEVKSVPEASGSAILNMISLTQAEYDTLTPVATTLYVITDIAASERVWVDELLNRLVSTDYTNDTGAEMELSIMSSHITSAGVKITIDGIVIFDGISPHDQTYGVRYDGTITVPAGSIYNVTVKGSLAMWQELKVV